MSNFMATGKAVISTLSITLTSIFVFQTDGVAQSYDIDCKVILCLAGGFPSGCADARSYMFNRINSKPPKPPFGFCSMSNGTNYSNYTMQTSYIHDYDCPKHKKMKRNLNGGVICYDSTVALTNRNGDKKIYYVGQVPAQRLNYQIQITLEPGSKWEYKSDVFRIFTPTGYVTTKKSN